MSIGRILLVGAGGVGTAFARIAARRRFADLVIADYDLGRAERAAQAAPDRYAAVQDRGWFTTEPFSEPETFTFPAGIGPVECVNVEHEEVLLIPRWVDARRVTFKYGLGAEFIGVLRTLHKLGLDATDPVSVGGQAVSPRDMVAACLPDPATLGDRMTGLTCAGTWVTGTARDRAPREVYLYHVVDNAWSMAEYGSQAVVWQTAVNPVVALELIDSGAWSGTGVLGPEALPAQPFLDLLTDYGSPWACEERVPAGK
jgi:saccharopine dehydrogenase (NAD+, L-lysine forming)